MFMLFERIRVVTLPRRLIRGYFRFFGQMLEQNEAIMGYVKAKLEVRIRRGLYLTLNGPSSGSPPSTLSSQATKKDPKGSQADLGKGTIY